MPKTTSKKSKTSRRSYSGYTRSRMAPRRRGARAQRLPQAAAIVARAAADKLKQKRLAEDLGAILEADEAQKMLKHVSDPEYTMRRLQGRGGYTFGDFLRQAEPYADRFLNKGLPKLLGGVDQIAGSARRLLGRGAYGVNQSGTSVNDLFTAGDKDDIILSHTEFIQTITPTTGDFETQYSSVINPGLVSFAPMLAQIAQYYEEYEMLQCVFTFKSTVVDGNDNAAGTVMMATQYNPTNPLFTNDLALDNYAHSCVSKVTQDMHHGIECEPFETGQAKVEYVRTGDVPTGQDPKTYDLGVFQLSTVGAFPNLQIGRLYCTYRCRLSKLKLVPVVPLNTGISTTFFRAQGTSITDGSLLGNGSTGTVFFNSANATSYPTLNNNTIIIPNDLPVGRYHLVLHLSLNAPAAIGKGTTYLGSVSIAVDNDGPTGNYYNFSPAAGVLSTLHTFEVIFDHTGASDGQIIFGFVGIVANADNQVTVSINQINPNVGICNRIAP